MDLQLHGWESTGGGAWLRVRGSRFRTPSSFDAEFRCRDIPDLRVRLSATTGPDGVPVCSDLHVTGATVSGALLRALPITGMLRKAFREVSLRDAYDRVDDAATSPDEWLGTCVAIQESPDGSVAMVTASPSVESMDAQTARSVLPEHGKPAPGRRVPLEHVQIAADAWLRAGVEGSDRAEAAREALERHIGRFVSLQTAKRRIRDARNHEPPLIPTERARGGGRRPRAA